MSSKFYVGMDLTGFANNSVQRPVSRVTLKVDEECVFTAGDDSGLELTADCPHATQEMVNAVLEQVKGIEYQMYEAADVNIDPSAELGDGIVACDVYSVISRINDDGSGFPSVSAPGYAELEDEYPAGGPMTHIINRKLAETRSRITKTAEEIRLEVERVSDNVTEMSSSFSVELGKISSNIRDISGNYSRLEQTIDSFSLSVNNGSTSSAIQLMANGAVISSQDIVMDGLVSFKGLSDGTTTINGGCIKTGSIESISIKGSEITGSTITGGTLYSESANRLYGVTVRDGEIVFLCDEEEVGRFMSQSKNAFNIRVPYGKALIVGTEDQNILQVGSDYIVFGETSMHSIDCYNNIDMKNYSILNTSDIRLKKNVTPSDVDALSVMNAIETYSFDWREDGKHENLGFIAQQLEKVCPDFVSISQSDGHYSTKDMKIIPYLVKAIQELSDKISMLSHSCGENGS